VRFGKRDVPYRDLPMLHQHDAVLVWHWDAVVTEKGMCDARCEVVSTDGVEPQIPPIKNLL